MENKAEMIGERIRQRRIELGMSQEELSKKLGYSSRSSINKIEKSARNLTQSKIKDIALALDTTPSYIMGWEETNKPDYSIESAYLVKAIRNEPILLEINQGLTKLDHEELLAIYSAMLPLIKAYNDKKE